MRSKRAWELSRLLGLSLAAAAGTAATGQAAYAQQSAGSEPLEEVVVTTARQREEALQDVPASITAITTATLEAASVERAADFVRLTPGVSMVQTAEVADAQVNIRGINGARDAENSFALIIDGILQTNPAAFNREYADLKQLEIVKGPQGAIYGRNAAAGAIIVTTTKPAKEFGGDVKVGFGEDNTQTGSLVLSGPISDRAGWKVAADYRKTDGFYRNTFLSGNPKDVDDFKGWNVNARFLFEPTDDATLDVKAHYGKVDAASISFNGDFVLPAFAGAPLPNAALFNEDVNDHVFNFVFNTDSFNKQEAKDLSLKWNQNLSFGTLTAWALYSDIQNSLGSDGTSGAFGFLNNVAACQNTSAALLASGRNLVPPQIIFFAAPNTPPAGIYGPYTATACDGTQYQERNQKDYSFEFRLASAGDERLRWQAGGYYLNIDREVGVNTGIDLGQGVIVEQLYAGPTSANPTINVLWDKFKSEVYAGFGSLDYDVTDTLAATVALRYDEERRKVHSLVPSSARIPFAAGTSPILIPTCGALGGGTPLNPGLCPSLNPNVRADGTLADQERTFTQVQPKVSLTWKASPDWTYFANWGIGFKSGGFNNQGAGKTVDLFINCVVIAGNCGANGIPARRSVLVRDVFDKERSSAAEIGFKSFLAEKRIQLDASLFYTDVDNMQFFEFLVGNFGLLRVVNNIDKVKLKGAELSLNARVTDELRLIAGFSRVMSEITKNTSRPASVGNQSPYTPSYTATAGAEFNVPLQTNGWRVEASAFWNLVGPTWFHVIQAQENPTLFGAPGNFTKTHRDSFATIDTRVALASDHWSVALVGKNVTDTKYLQEVIPAPEFGGAFIHPGTERRFSLEVGYKF